MMYNVYSVHVGTVDILGTVVVRWTDGQQVERLILYQGHDHNKIHLIGPGYPRPSIAYKCRITA